MHKLNKFNKLISEGERFFKELTIFFNSLKNLSPPRKTTTKVENMLINGMEKDIKIMNRDILKAHEEKEQRIKDYCCKLEFLHNQREDTLYSLQAIKGSTVWQTSPFYLPNRTRNFKRNRHR